MHWIWKEDLLLLSFLWFLGGVPRALVWPAQISPLHVVGTPVILSLQDFNASLYKMFHEQSIYIITCTYLIGTEGSCWAPAFPEVHPRRYLQRPRVGQVKLFPFPPPLWLSWGLSWWRSEAMPPVFFPSSFNWVSCFLWGIVMYSDSFESLQIWLSLFTFCASGWLFWPVLLDRIRAPNEEY